MSPSTKIRARRRHTGNNKGRRFPAGGRRDSIFARRLNVELLEDRRVLAALTVNSLADTNISDTNLTLREAILLVNSAGDANAALGRALSVGETAQVDTSTDAFGTDDAVDFSVTGTINIGSQLLITDSVSIAGPGADMLTIDAGGGTDGVIGNLDGFRHFEIDDATATPINVDISRMGLTGGDINGGGAIRSRENVTLSSMTIDGNASSFGGAVNHSVGQMTIDSSTLSNNTVTNNGGAIDNGGQLEIINSTLSGNAAGVNGGAIMNYSSGATVGIQLSTLHNNSAGYSTGNSIANFGGTVDIENSIVSDSLRLQGGTVSGDYSLFGASDPGISGTNNLFSTDPMLDPLGNNGGPTQTHELQSGSPAINAGDPNISNAPMFDQRGDGFNRIQGGRIDIGAFELTFANNPPTGAVTILGMPIEGQTLMADTGLLDDADGLGTISYQWRRDGADIAGAMSSTFTLMQADVGSVITVVASYTDGFGFMETVESASVYVATGTVTISGTPEEDQPLTASNTLDDFSGLATVDYQWRRDGEDISSATSSTYTLVQDDVGSMITVVATTTAIGVGVIEIVESAPTATVANVNDSPTGAVTISGMPIAGQTLTADTSSLADEDGLGAFSYQWRRDGADIAGAMSSTFTLMQADVGSVITVVASYTDGFGFMETVESASVFVTTGTVTISGTPEEDQPLTASNTLDDFSGLATVDYQWRRDGEDISSATSSTYTLVQDDVGSMITVVATTTAIGVGVIEIVESAPTATVANVNDSPTGAVTISGMPIAGQTLTADTSSLADEDGLGAFSYQWRRDGADIVGATSFTYTLVQADVGTIVSVVVSYTDVQGTMESVTSDQVIGLVVDSPLDVSDGNFGPGEFSLREAIEQAKASNSEATILFDATVFNGGANNTITLNGSELAITDSLTIDASALSSNIIIDARHNSRVINFTAATGDLTLKALTLENGRTTGNAMTPTETTYHGAAIRFGSSGTLELNNSTLRNNKTLGTLARGGAIFSSDGAVKLADSHVIGNSTVGGSGHGGAISTLSGSVTLDNSTLNDNLVFGYGDSSAYGGGIFTYSGSVSLDESTLSGNRALGDSHGGGILSVMGTITLQKSTLSDNNAYLSGGAIYSKQGEVSVNISTLSNNTAGTVGGAIFTKDANIKINDGTLTANSAQEAGAIYSENGSLTVVNSIVAANIAAEYADISPVDMLTINDSLIGAADSLTITGSGNQTGTIDMPLDPMLGGLADNGGATFTHALLTGSPAIDMGGAAYGSLTDQRGFTRDVGTSIDIGAFELRPNNVMGPVTISGTPTEDQVLTASNTLSDPDGLGTINYQWQRNGSDIVGATAGTYTLVQADVGTMVKVVASYIDGAGKLESASSEATTEIANVNDLPTGVVTLDGVAAVGQTLTVNTSQLADEDGLGTLTYDWKRDGASFTVPGDSYVLTTMDLGNVISVVVAYTDQQDNQETVTSNDSQSVLGAPFIVDNTGDVSDGEYGPGQQTLREAIEQANTGDPNLQLIWFDRNVFTPGNNTIQLDSELEITDSVTIDATNLTTNIVLDGQDSSRVINFSSMSGNLTLAGLDVTGGDVAGHGAGVYFASAGTLRLDHSAVRDNSSSDGGGGGIYAAGTVLVENSTISGNSTSGSSAHGGGIYAAAVTIDSSTISGNSTSGTNADGGGIYVTGDVSVANSTITANTAGRTGGGIYVKNSMSGPLFSVTSSIIAKNTDAVTAPDLSPDPGSSLSISDSLIGSTNLTILGSGNQIGTTMAPVEPLLSPLANNGGRTETHALMPTSPAIDAGMSTDFSDQRGLPFSRNVGNASDIGAYEAQSLSLIVDTITDDVDGNYSSGNLGLREAIVLANANPGHDTITFVNALSGQTVLLMGTELYITESLTVDASSLTSSLVIDAQNSSRALHFSSATGDDLTLSGLTVLRGRTFGSDEDRNGAGIRFASSGTLKVIESTIRENGSSSAGGGIYTNSGNVTLESTTLNSNTAASGGGIFTGSGNVTLEGATLSGNTAEGGGGILTYSGNVTLESATLSGNTAQLGGGILVVDNDQASNVTITNSILAGNSASTDPDLSVSVDTEDAPGVTLSVKHSLIGSTDLDLEGTDNLVGTLASPIDPRLGPVADNGGPTPTQALLFDSPAIDMGISSEFFDQRGTGFPRNIGEAVDIGAFEATPLIVNRLTDVVASDLSNGMMTLREAVLLANTIGGTDTIVFDSSLAGRIIELDGSELEITESLTIDGSSLSDSIRIDGQQSSRVLNFTDTSGDLTLNNLTITGGRTSADSESGGGIRFGSTGKLEINRSTVIGNETEGRSARGGGIYVRTLSSSSRLVINHSIVDGNVTKGVDADGGGIYFRGGQMTLNNSSIRNNQTQGNSAPGGGIHISSGFLFANFAAIQNNRTTGSGSSGGGMSIGSATLNHSDISGNSTGGANGGGINSFLSSVNLTLNGSTVSNNSTGAGGGNGGGIYSRGGQLNLNGSVIQNNSTEQGNGGAAGIRSGAITATGSTVSGNTAGGTGQGGGFWADTAWITLNSSTLNANRTATSDGGGIFTEEGNLLLNNSTVSTNTAGGTGRGGGISTYSGNAYFNNSTIAENNAGGVGGGIYVEDSPSNPTLQLTNTIIAQNNDNGGAANTAPDLLPDPSSLVSINYSLIGATDLSIAGTGNQIGSLVEPINPLLGPLTDNGGPTLTHAPRFASPAINMGDPNFIAAVFDQRGLGFNRILDDRVDIGSIEVSAGVVIQLPSGSANDIVVRQNASDLEVIDQSGPTILSSTPMATTNSLTIVGSDTDVDTITIDYTSGFFTLPEGIEIAGGTNANDVLTVTGNGATRAHYSAPLGQTQLNLMEGSSSAVVSYGGFEDMTFDGLLTFSAADILDVADDELTIGSLTPIDLPALTRIAGGTLTSSSPISIGPAESLIGSGTIAGVVAGEASSFVQATGDLTLGDATSPVGFFTRGQLLTGQHSVTLLDANQAVLGSLTSLGQSSSPGTLISANGLLVDFGNNVTGYGTIETPTDVTKLLMNNGSISGNSPTEPITFDSSYIKGVGSLADYELTNGATHSPGFSPAAVYNGSGVYGANSTTIIELGGTTPGSSGHDQINHAGTATLGGTLEVEFINDFHPSYGDTLDVMTWTSHTGQFSGFTGMLLDDDMLGVNSVAVIPVYQSDGLQLAVTGPADANLDGQVTFLDFQALQNGYNQPGSWQDGDFNLDGTVTFLDFQILQNHYRDIYFLSLSPTGGFDLSDAQNNRSEPRTVISRWDSPVQIDIAGSNSTEFQSSRLPVIAGTRWTHRSTNRALLRSASKQGLEIRDRVFEQADFDFDLAELSDTR